MFKIVFILYLFSGLAKSESIWNFHNLPEFFKKISIFSQHDDHIKAINTKELKDVCDENQLLLQLARLYITSPERIILLLTTKSIANTCLEVSDVLSNINNTITCSRTLPQDNLYMKLNNGLHYFNSYACLQNSETKGLVAYHECLNELHEDLLDCEGPPDWFEKSNDKLVCEYYNEIINCNYIKTGMLCGLKPALMLRSFSDEIMKRIIKFKCKISRSLPYIDDPMPARASHFILHHNQQFFSVVLFIFIHFCSFFKFK